MSDEMDLVRYEEPLSGDVGTDFFRTAYEVVCASDTDRRINDRVFLQGGLTQIGIEYQLNLTIQIGQQASVRLLGAFLSLALAEAAQDDPVRAVELLRKRPLDLFIKLGMQMHDALRERAANVRKQAVIKLKTGVYGILEPDDEAELEKIARNDVVFSETVTYHQADDFVTSMEQLLELAAHLPFALVIDYGSYRTSFHKEAYRRRNEATPNPMGGLLFLFVRSYLVKALTTPVSKKADALPVLMKEGPTLILSGARGTDFLHRNLVSFAQHVQTLVADIFFDPASVVATAPVAVEALKCLFGTPLVLRDDSVGNTRFPAVKMADFDRVVEDLAKNVLRTFSEGARKYFATAADVTVSATDLTRFWYPNLFMKVGEFADHPSSEEGGEGKEQILSVSDRDIAVAVVDLQALLKIPPDKIVDYTASAGEWPPERRQAFLNRYTWSPLLQNISDDALADSLGKLITRFGPELLRKLSGRRLTLAFWFKVWAEAPATREAILQFFQEDRFPHRITASSLMNAVAGAYGVNEDGRLFTLLLTRVMREVQGEYLVGVGAEQMGRVIYQLLNHPSSLRLLMTRVDPRKRQEYLDSLGSDALMRYTNIMRSG